MRQRLGVILVFGLIAVNVFAGEMRGLWVDAFGPGFQTREQVRQLGEQCRKYNFNAVFVQVRKRGDAYYFPQSPNDEPRPLELSADFDPLAEIIKECHGKEPRIEVHAWVVGYFIWAFDKPPRQPNHVFNRHPEWLTKDSIGQKIVGQGYFLDPGHPEAMAHLLNVAKDIVSHYDVDGLHWDYLRYPNRDAGYNETALKRFKEEVSNESRSSRREEAGLNSGERSRSAKPHLPPTLSPPFEGAEREKTLSRQPISENPLPDDPVFCEWRRKQITDFVRWSTIELLKIKPKVVISAAVFSNYKDSRDHRFADWVEWNKEGILDVTVPMDFSADNPRVFNPRADFARTNQGLASIYIGQGAYMNDKANTLEQLKHCREKGFRGTLLYSYRNPMAGQNSSSVEMESGQSNIPKVTFVIDNQQADVPETWRTSQFGKPHKEDYRFKEKSEDGYAKFGKKIAIAGTYEVEEWHVAGLNRMESVSHQIIHASGTNVVKVNQKINGSRWNSLGRFYFDNHAQVWIRGEISAERTVIVADAVRLKLVSTNDIAEASQLEIAAPDTNVEEMRKKQDEVFGFLKENYQPTWKQPPELPGKSKPSTGIVTGKVSDAKGQPMSNIPVTIKSVPSCKQQTDIRGFFAFFAVSPGDHVLEATIGEASPIQKRFTAEVGKVGEVNFRLADK